MVDLVQWESFPEQIIDYSKDIQINGAGTGQHDLRPGEFKDITKLDSFPAFLHHNVTDTPLCTFCNGEINYQIRGVHVKTSVVWNYKAPEGTGDTFIVL